MDPDQGSSRSRKHKYTPRPPKAHAPKNQLDNKQDEDSTPARLLSRRYENSARREPKVERKSSVEVAFSPGISSTSLRSYGTSKAIDNGTNSGSPSTYFSKEQIRSRRSSAATEDQNDTSTIDVTDNTINASARKFKREYKEPWDYNNSYYPITLPLRKPNSGNPEILDEEEFGEAATSSEYDENTVNSAAELELLKSEQHKMFLFQLPKNMPFNEGKEKEQIRTTGSGKARALEELPSGYMGKMQVYKSGAIKLKLGEALFDLSPGTKCGFAQDIVAVNFAQKHICNLGEISNKVVVVPDLDSIDLRNTGGKND
ncbi:DNA-directed RNA polymerase III subunit rpc4 isoform X2 [Vigna angularis]|uniref:DNA-directed RNA polymerase III subunit rpc4 isoform X2 n=1 Tax=Phaseolus angularis TaxID=3914 RepID=UPI00080A6CCF|nr:DNA-directed RNA polymerase III subunit rpc4 isoform X2 [Vigna angularis]